MLFSKKRFKFKPTVIIAVIRRCFFVCLDIGVVFLAKKRIIYSKISLIYILAVYMGMFKSFKDKHGDLFVYLEADHLHPHDKFINLVALRFLPDSITPNRVTFFRVITTPIVFLLILHGFYKIGLAAFLFVAFTDAVDGSMARIRSKITKFGMMFDPLADKFLIGSMVLLLVFQNYNFWLGVALLGIEIVIIMTALVAQKKFKTVRAANIWGKIKMILQVLAVFLILLALMFDFPNLFTIAAGFFGLAIGFAILSLFMKGA